MEGQKQRRRKTTRCSQAGRCSNNLIGRDSKWWNFETHWRSGDVRSRMDIVDGYLALLFVILDIMNFHQTFHIQLGTFDVLHETSGRLFRNDLVSHSQWRAKLHGELWDLGLRTKEEPDSSAPLKRDRRMTWQCIKKYSFCSWWGWWGGGQKTRPCWPHESTTCICLSLIVTLESLQILDTSTERSYQCGHVQIQVCCCCQASRLVPSSLSIKVMLPLRSSIVA